MIKIEEHLGLVYSTAKKFYKSSSKTVDEINSAALLGLVLAANKFDESKGLKFNTFAIPTIIGSIKNDIYRDKSNFIRRTIDKKQIYEKAKTTLSLNKVFDEEKGIELIECCSSKFDIDKELEKIDLKVAINKLDEFQKKIINMIYFEDKTQSEVAKILGTTQANISRLNKKALIFLRSRLLEERNIS